MGAQAINLYIYTMDFNYQISAKVSTELDSLNFKSSKDKIETAITLCEKNGIPFSDLILYEDWIERQKQSPIKLNTIQIPAVNLLI